MRITIFKSVAERRVETATWGLLLIWAGVVIGVENFREGIPQLVAGGILLLSWLVQKLLGGEAGVVYWGGGIGFALWGLNDLTEGQSPSVFSVVLIAIGVAIVVRSLSTPKRRPGGHLRDVSGPRDIPRRDDTAN